MLFAAPLFAQIDGRTAFWNGIVTSHSNSMWKTRSGITALTLLVTTFTAPNGNSTQRWMVETNGMSRSWRESLIAIQGNPRRQLSKQDMASLNRTLATLPPSADQTSSDWLILISLRRNGEWETRRYDHADLSEQVGTLLSQIEEMTSPKRSPKQLNGRRSMPTTRSAQPTP